MRLAEQTTARTADTETKSVFYIPPDGAKEARLGAGAAADCAAGRVIPHDAVGEWLLKLAEGQGVLPPVGDLVSTRSGRPSVDTRA